MPHVADQFSGHLFPGDPRGPLTGAYGCIWPTFPAMRYQIHSEDATDNWDVWNDGGALVGLSSPIGEHDSPTWQLIGPQPPFEFVTWEKLPDSTELDGYFWQLTWKLISDPLILLDELHVDRQKCNVNVALPDWSSGPSFPGSFGLTARADQVLWNKTEPPG